MTLNRPLLVVTLTVVSLASLGGRQPTTKPAANHDPNNVDPWTFLKGYRISHYLEVAEGLQKLDPTKRAERLKEMALDTEKGSEVFPLCRMLFTAKPKGEFRAPRIGQPHFSPKGDWPLHPIAVVDGVPILVVRGYMIGGLPERPARYVDYCLKECDWSDTKYVPVDAAKRKTIVDRFIAAHPERTPLYDTAWIREQAE